MKTPRRTDGAARGQNVEESGVGPARFSIARTSEQVTLRPYQIATVDHLRASLRHLRCIWLPTGGGKTIIFGSIAAGVVARAKPDAINVGWSGGA